MKKIKRFLIATATITTIAMTAAGCASTQSSVAAETVQSAADTTSGVETSSNASAVTTTSVSTVSDTLIDTSDLFTDRDLAQTADTSEATSYTVESGQNITITEAGVYVLSGTASDCTIIVSTEDEDAKVQLVLDGLNVTNTNTPVIYVVSADKCFVTTTAGSQNTLTVTGAFTADGATNTDAVIFSKEDLVLNGEGVLTIKSSENAVTSKDDLRITGGTYAITAGKNGFEGKDSIAISGGVFTINASADGFHSENADDNTLGYIYVSGGTFDINAGDDGIHATTVAEIDGGEFAIDAVEGIEGTYIQINDGTISISASDDGINAAAKSTAYDVTIEINGGLLTIVMGSGDTDAVDANGSIYVNGGDINITATSAFDYDVTGKLNGGTVIVNGSQITEMTTSMGGGRGAMGTKVR